MFHPLRFVSPFKIVHLLPQYVLLTQLRKGWLGKIMGEAKEILGIFRCSPVCLGMVPAPSVGWFGMPRQNQAGTSAQAV